MSATAFVGRSEERRVLDGTLTKVRGGESQALGIRGGAGIGTTALLRYTARQASGFRTAEISGLQAEMELPFAGIHQLCSAMPERLRAPRGAAQDAPPGARGGAAGG